MKDFGTIIEIGDILVSEEVVTEYFACDYAACKGCCCIIGDSGAPLQEEELEPLERYYEQYAPLMSEQGRAVVREKGFFEIDRDGDLVTPVVPVSEECAFCHFDAAGNCFCAIERKFCQGRIPFRKPQSCSLYPIRVVDLGGGRKGLNLHRWSICKDAYAKGQKEKVRVYEFLRGPLTEAFGEEFYSALETAAKMVIAAS
ncbi:MAG: DUF3109 family protein [Bacteroidales bacterium]|nr:DUF3109 family protein [Bacteroidales bacterium]